MRIPVLFGEIYPRKRWELKRREIIRRALPRIVIWGLGARRTNFVVGKDKWQAVDTTSDVWVDEGRELTNMWKEIWRELSIVTAGCAAISVAALWAAWTTLF
jgi:hypothetical protein